jgi:hypothetical protein
MRIIMVIMIIMNTIATKSILNWTLPVLGSAIEESIFIGLVITSCIYVQIDTDKAPK